MTVPMIFDGETTRPMTDVEYAQWQADQQTFAATGQQETAAAWVGLRMKRDRWLAQTDYIEVFLNAPSSMTHLPAAIQADVTANAAAWTVWRQQIRDLPAAVTDPASVSWPTQPPAPVVHLT